jgi:ubiquinone/menaquinone biosynthesis C-methylase UbiE
MSDSQEYFDDVAGSWDEIRAGYFTEEMRDAAIERARLGPDAVVVDVGTGTGFVIQGLAPRFAQVYGFDHSAEMIAVAAHNLAAFNNVKLQQAHGDRLPLPDQAVDAVFGNMYLHHASDPATAIAEMARLLRPGGRLVLTDLDEHHHEWMRKAMADRWLGFRREDIRDWCTAAGLCEVAVEDAAGKCCPASPAGGDLALSIFLAIGMKEAQLQASQSQEKGGE